MAGRGRDATRFREGDRVGIAWLRRTCGACLYCATDRENLCERAAFTGWHADGGYAEYAVVHEDFAYAIPAGFSDVEAAPLLCAGIIGYRALKLARGAAGRPARHVRLRLLGPRHDPGRPRAATGGLRVHARAGAPRAGAAAGRRLGRRRATSRCRDRADGTILFAPAGELVPVALRNLARGGTLALAGIYMTPIPPLDYEADLFYERGRAIGDRQHAGRRRRAPGRGRPDPGPAGHHEFPLEVANQALELLKRGVISGSGVLLTDEGFRV